MKFVDLFIQTVMLLQILENGLPIALVAVFTVIVAANALWCAILMFLPLKQAVLVENFVDLIFDLLIAVGYPMILVCYCLSAFKFDRAKLTINLAAFPQAPKTYAEWMNPKNVTTKVAQLATTGFLQIVQLTNRKLEVIPEELRDVWKGNQQLV
ncbi:hypothetical protein F444_08456 [Phytophthora nicotianae P1976]|uniref:Uncharacterized protein n=1 Tax=Phytophthora nicotianae P1976 TaxID=1317066 RepID=A0A081AB02_PHYNI|nr:hypothetical protein F444_08456 [Phytophthora nicotianae P1976]